MLCYLLLLQLRPCGMFRSPDLQIEAFMNILRSMGMSNEHAEKFIGAFDLFQCELPVSAPDKATCDFEALRLLACSAVGEGAQRA